MWNQYECLSPVLSEAYLLFILLEKYFFTQWIKSILKNVYFCFKSVTSQPQPNLVCVKRYNKVYVSWICGVLLIKHKKELTNCKEGTVVMGSSCSTATNWQGSISQYCLRTKQKNLKRNLDWDLNPGLLGDKREHYHCAMLPPSQHHYLCFCSTSLPLASTRWVLLASLSLRCPHF